MAGTCLIAVSRRTAAWRVMQVVGLPRLLHRTAVRASRVWQASTTSRPAWAAAIAVCLVVLASGLPLSVHPIDRLASLVSLVGTTLRLVSRRTAAWRVMLARGHQQSVPRRQPRVSRVRQASTTSRPAWAAATAVCLVVLASGLPLSVQPTDRLASLVSPVGTTLRLVSHRTAAWRVMQVVGLPRSLHPISRSALVVHEATSPRIQAKPLRLVWRVFQEGGAQ